MSKILLRQKNIIIAGIFLSAVIFLFTSAPAVRAETCTWTASSSANMSDAGNWSGCTLDSTDDLVFDGAVTTTNATWDSGLTQVVSTTVSSSYTGTISIGSAAATSTGNFTVNGGIVTTTGASQFNVGGNFTVSGSGVFSATTGTVRLYATSKTLGGAGGITFYNLQIPGTITLNGNVTTTNNLDINDSSASLSLASYSIIVGGNFSNSGAVTHSSGLVTLSGSGKTLGGSGSTQLSTIIVPGSITLAGNVTSSESISVSVGGTLNASTYTIVFSSSNAGDPAFDVFGTFTPASSTVIYGGQDETAAIASLTYYNLTVNFNAALSGNVTTTNILTINSGTSLDANTRTINLTRATGTPFVIDGTFTANASTVNYAGATSANIASTTYYNLTVNTAGTLTGNITVSSTLTINSGKSLGGGNGNTIKLYGSESPFVNNGTFTANTSSVFYESSGTVAILPTTYYELLLRSGTYTLNGNITTTIFSNNGGNFTIASGNILYINSELIDPSRRFINTGTITESGIIKLAAASVKLTDVSGNEVSTFTGGTDSAYVSVTDYDGNLDGNSIETIAGSVVTENTNSDSETITLTETGAATGIFRSAAIAITGGTNSASNNSGAFNVNGNGTLTLAYTDSKDSTDTGSDTASFTASAYSAPGGGGGGSVFVPSSVGSGAVDKSLGIGQIGNIGVITTSGVNYLTYINSKASFDVLVSKSKKVETHELSIVNLDLFSIAIQFIVQSTPQTIDLKLGQTASIDLDADGVKDIEIKFTNVWISRAELTLRALLGVKDVKASTGGTVNVIVSAVGQAGGYWFKRDFSFGAINADIRELQKYLNTNGFVVAKIGAGSPGKEINRFGPATKAALLKFQKANSLAATGKLDTATRAVLNGEVAAPIAVEPTPSSYVFKSNLYLGASGEAVKVLQQRLKDLGYFTYPIITGYFGPVTKAAVVKFQKDRNLKPYPGWVGPATRAALNNL